MVGGMSPANFPKRLSLSCAHDQFGGPEGGEHPTSRPSSTPVNLPPRPHVGWESRAQHGAPPHRRMRRRVRSVAARGAAAPGPLPSTWRMPRGMSRRRLMAGAHRGGEPEIRAGLLASTLRSPVLGQRLAGPAQGVVGVAGMKDALLPKSDRCPAGRRLLTPSSGDIPRILGPPHLRSRV